MKDLLLLGLLLGGLLCLPGCLAEADHTNPLDPLSDGYVGGGVVGLVVTEGPDAHPVPDAIVRLEPAGAGAQDGPRITITGGDGAFRFERVEPGRYVLLAEKAGYAAAEKALTVQGAPQDVLVALNGMPRVVAGSLVTVLEKEPFQQPVLSIEAAMEVEDPDDVRGIDSAWVAFPELGIGFALAPAGPAGVFDARVAVETLRLDDPKRFIGRRAVFHVRDAAGAEDSLVASPIVNVFTDPLRIDQPADFSIFPSSPNALTWFRVDSPLPIAYTVTVRRQGGVVLDTTVVDQRLVPLRTPLPSGEYTWSVVATDSFGNRNVGRATFRISDDANG